MTPQLIITLSPAGAVQAELPGANGSRRVVPVHSIDQIQRILLAQARGERGIGTDAEPTTAALIHWRDHKDRNDRNCVFCRSEKDAIAKYAKKKAPASELLKELGLL